MKIKDILSLWGGWDSPDIFDISIESKSEHITITALELVEGEYGNLDYSEIIRFGTYGKQDGQWKHYLWIKGELK